jgi:hypothetical protein
VKFNFRKIASVLASTVMLSSTVALAAAANFPSPFVKSGVADVAVVYGSTAAQTDLVAATDITTELNSALVTAGAATSVSGGDFVKLERSTDKFNLGNEMDDFYTNLDDEELSSVLKSGVYTSDDNEEFDFEQSLTFAGGIGLEHFTDSELDENEVPVIGFDLNGGDPVLNYTLEFTDPVDAGAWTTGNSLETSDITMLGRNYYVISARNTTATNHKITLLDSANSATITEGETLSMSVGGNAYDVSIVYIADDEVILDVKGTKTNKLGEGDVFKVGEDLYLGVKNILYNEKESGVSKVEISLGSGKIVLENTKEIQINNQDVSTDTDSVLNAYIDTDSNDLESITLEWILDDDAWIVPGTDLVLPGFETIKLSMGGFISSGEETTSLTPDGDDSIKVKTELKDGSLSMNLFYLNGSNTGIAGLGEKDSHKLVTNGTTDAGILLNESENSYFVATWISGDDAESYVFEISSIDDESGKNKTTIKNLVSNSEVVFSEVTKTKDVGSLQLTLKAASDTNKVAYITVDSSSGTTYSDRLVTKDGLMFKLPVNAGIFNATGVTSTNWVMNFTEETKDGDIQGGNSVLATIAVDGDDGLEPTTLTGVTLKEDGDDTDNYVGYVISDIATKFWQSKPSTGLNELEVLYPDEESYAEVYVSETGAAIVAEGGTKILPVKDSEAPAAKNLVVVGGSCVNSVAATLLGGALCGADFEAKTGVGAGSFLIETFARDGGAVATLVAGYNAEDTTNAAKYLTTQTVDTTVGKKYKGTTATTATLAQSWRAPMLNPPQGEHAEKPSDQKKKEPKGTRFQGQSK